MISQKQAKKLDDYDLCEHLENRLEVLSLCVEAVKTNHQGTDGLTWAFDDIHTLAREMKERVWENANQKEH